MEFKKGDKVFHKNLKLFGIFVDYAWENPNEEADVDFEMEDGYIEQRHVSINQLQKCSSNEEIRKRIGGITVDELRIKIEQLIEDLENETKNRNMNDLEEGRYKALCEVLDLIDEQKKWRFHHSLWTIYSTINQITYYIVFRGGVKYEKWI